MQHALQCSTPSSEPARFMSPPVVQHAGPHGFTVSIEVNRICKAWVEWGFDADTLDRQATAAHGGLIDAHDSCLVLPVTFEEPLATDAAVYYRVVGQSLNYANAYDITAGQPFHTTIRPLTIPRPEQPSITLAVVSDTHNRDGLLPVLAKQVDEVDPDILVWNGDVCQDLGEADEPAAILLRPGAEGSAPSCGGWASCRPMLFVAGNHDKRGVRARELSGILAPGPYPDLPTNTAARVGPVAVIGLDSGEDKPDCHPVFCGTAAYEPYRERQARWLETQLARPEIASAPFKIAFSHIPLRGLPGENDGTSLEGHARYAGQCAALWLPQLTGAGFQAVISGHTHQWRYDAPTKRVPIWQIVGGGPAPDEAVVTVIEATQSSMTISTRDLEGNVLATQTWKPDVSPKL